MPDTDVITRSEVIQTEKAKIWHVYPPHFSWAPIGARALCGHIKVEPTTYIKYGYGPDHCVVCMELYRG